jgi:hypothetical protein
VRVMNKVVPVVALAVGLAACSDASDDDVVTVSSEKGGGAALLEAMAAAQEEAGSYEFTMSTGVEGSTVTGTGAATYGPDLSEVNLTMTMDIGGSETTMLMVDGQIYVSMSPEAGMPVDVGWIIIDPDGSDPLSQQLGGLADEFGSSTDFQERFLEQAELITFEEVGTESIDGVDTTEYLMTIDAEDVGTFLDLDEDLPFGDLTYSLWVDDDYLPRMLRSDLGGFGEMEMRFSNFGADVDVEAPPADDVTDFGSLMESLMSELEELADLEGLSEDEIEELLDQLQSSLVG